MALGCLIDAGADLKELKDILSGLKIGRWSLDAEQVERNSVKATKINVGYEKDQAARKLKDILLLLEEAKLPTSIADKAAFAFHKLAEAEGKIHNKDKFDVHFHELGGQDTIVDIVGTVAALEILEIKDVYSSPVRTGYGTINTDHGVITNPGPAVLEILKDIPIQGTDIEEELITPTGAVLLATLAKAFGPMPEMSLKRVGYGAGSKIIPKIPNLAQVVIGKPGPDQTTGGGSIYSQMFVLETNLDDITGENLSFCLQSCLENGALDAWITPAVMKKGRPGNVFCCLIKKDSLEVLLELLFDITGTFGIRVREVGRYELSRHFETVSVSGYEIRVKSSRNRIKVEYDDVKTVSRQLRKPPQEIIRLAESAWHNRPQI